MRNNCFITIFTFSLVSMYHQCRKEVGIAWWQVGTVMRISQALLSESGNNTWMIHFHKIFFGFQHYLSPRSIHNHQQLSLPPLFTGAKVVWSRYLPGTDEAVCSSFLLSLLRRGLQDLGLTLPNEIWMALALNICLESPLLYEKKWKLFFWLPIR